MNLSRLSSCGALVLLSLCGCGLLGGGKKPNVEEMPPYYHQGGSYVSVPMEHPPMERENPGKKSAVSSRAELEKLQQEADDFAEEQARKKAVEAERADQSKKSIWNWFGSGDRMSGMSNEAKAVNQSLDAKRVNTTLDR